MRKIRVPAFAKVNLRLDVLGKRPDGYHELRTIFQTISLHDILRFCASRKPGIQLNIVGNAQLSSEAIEKMLAVARQEFSYVIIDAGSRFDLTDAKWFEQADTAYLVMQAGIPELRNSHRLISEFFKSGTPELDIVLNRYVKSSMGVDEEHIEKALTRPIKWKIPSDYYNVRRMQNEAIPLALDDSPIARVLQDMARAACGMDPKPEKRKGFSLFR